MAQIDWSELPLECIDLIIHFVDLSQVDYWVDITTQKDYDCNKGLVKASDVPWIEYHMNKRITLKQFARYQRDHKYEVGRDPLERFHAMGLIIAPNGRVAAERLWTQEKSDRATDLPNTHTWQQATLFHLFALKEHKAPYKVKVIKGKQKGRAPTCKCSLCGKVGHNKGNKKFHP